MKTGERLALHRIESVCLKVDLRGKRGKGFTTLEGRTGGNECPLVCPQRADGGFAADCHSGTDCAVYLLQSGGECSAGGIFELAHDGGGGHFAGYASNRRDAL